MVRVTSYSQSERGKHAQPVQTAKGNNVKHLSSQRTGFDSNYQPPWRKSTTIAQRAFTLVTTTNRDKTNKVEVPKDLENHPAVSRRKQTKPQQLFWPYRLSGLRAMRANTHLTPPPQEEIDADEYEEGAKPDIKPRLTLSAEQELQAAVADSTEAEEILMPQQLQHVIADAGDVKVPTLASIVSLLGNRVTLLKGQSVTKRNLEIQPGAFIQPEQPLIQAVDITDSDIQAQEKRVLDARRRLEETIKHFG